MIRKVESVEELSIVASAAGYPSTLPPSGVYVEADNKRYLLALRNGVYIAWDISVYSSDGTLLSGPSDVWLNAAGELVTESLSELKIIAIVVLGSILALKVLK